MTQNRTHTCNELRMEHVGQSVQLSGWMENVREVGQNLAFVILRDYYGTTQVVIETEEMMQIISSLNKETVIEVQGVVRERSSKNANLPTGDIEVVPTSIVVLGTCQHNELPFQINRSREADEAIRLKHRYLDLRNPDVKKNIVLRCQVVAAIRAAMTAKGFLEITTPILTASSPEGARDYLVPARKHPGKFYALPQAPQQFKQLLMASGFDKYFQIAPCFRDEDARGDRTPGEFYQLDMEMSFATQEDVLTTLEEVLIPIFQQFGKYERVSTGPLRRIAFNDAMERYGSDKPDLRIDLEVQDITETVKGCGFGPFDSDCIKAVVVHNFDQARKWIDKLLVDVEVQTGNKVCWVKVDENGALTGGISKFLTERQDALIQALDLKPGSFVCMAAGKKLAAQKTAGVVRTMLGKRVPGHFDEEQYAMCWIVNFPMYEQDEETGALEFCHNPFSMPQGGMKTLIEAEGNMEKLLAINADQYDLVVNGYETASGAVRNHSPEIMIKAFELVGLGEEDVKSKFPAMYNAFTYGAPPHAGAAPGIDRIIMLLAGEESIREVITFPMNQKAQDLMMGAPSTVEQKQLDELHIAITAVEDEE
ncbi:MAG: aspartate--tRNA ligase [Oscillospiraceae bacterium]|nr:aspartate--tRNA ligase [Oscillospiraceae bacterium]